MRSLLMILVVFVSIVGCKKETETVVFSNNNIPAYSEVPTILVENYVNRVYIDLIGREPTDIEMSSDVTALESADLSADARIALVQKLMNSEVYIEGDSSYSHAYHQKFYDDNKARFLDGMSEGEVVEQYQLYYGISVQDSLAGNMLAYEVNRNEANKVKAVIDSKYLLRTEEIMVDDMCKSMCYNVIYDNLHMNTFNYINATFDDLFFRFPTDAELDEAYEPIEQAPSSEDPDLTGYLFGEVFSNKDEYINVLTRTAEFSEGMIRWAYQSLLSREPTSAEVYFLLPTFNNGQNIKAVQQSIIIGDEYAGFN
jgi:hypothetical protein